MEIELFNQTDVNLDKEFEVVHSVLIHGLEKLNIKEAIFNVEDDKTFNPDIRILGDVYISIDKAKSQSIEYSHSLLRELCFLAVHGMLHLLGYDHMKKEDEEVMFKLQDEILNEMNIRR